LDPPSSDKTGLWRGSMRKGESWEARRLGSYEAWKEKKKKLNA
jgi:hypothetical protein